MSVPLGLATELAIIFLTAFVIVAFCYAYLVSFTRWFYKNQRDAELSHVEKLIKTGRATFGQRVTLFWESVFGSIVVLNCYVAAAVLTAIYWIIWM
jgi:ABC-type sugar transport system permease subunit